MNSQFGRHKLTNIDRDDKITSAFHIWRALISLMAV